MSMLFDFESFLEELKDNPEKKEVIAKYEKFFGPIQGDIKDQIWYREYVSKFNTLAYKVPEELKNDFDWVLLMQLVASSFSSDGLLDFNDGSDEKDETIKEDSGEEEMKESIEEEEPKGSNSTGELPEFVISVQSGDQVVVKKISELWGFQILRLYEIYIEEQLNLQILIAEDEKEKEAIYQQREARTNRWQLVLDNLEKEKLVVEEEKEKTEKLSGLMDQL